MDTEAFEKLLEDAYHVCYHFKTLVDINRKGGIAATTEEGDLYDKADRYVKAYLNSNILVNQDTTATRQS